MKKFLIALALASLACCAWGVEPQTNPERDQRIRRQADGIDADVWRAAMDVFQKADTVSSATFDAHKNATTGIHGIPADTRFLTASETILDAQIPPAIARDVEIPGVGSFSFQNLSAGTVPVASGGTGAIASSAALTALGGAHLNASNTFVYQQTINGASLTGNIVLNLKYISGDGDNEGLLIGPMGNLYPSGYMFFATNKGILASTTDGADVNLLSINAGGAFSSSRGAGIDIYGNEHASTPGKVVFYAGNAASSTLEFRTGAGIMRMTIDPAGIPAVATGAIKLTPRAEPPSNAVEGYIYTDTDHHVYYHNGTTWVQMDN